jgi:hypothetical protein
MRKLLFAAIDGHHREAWEIWPISRSDIGILQL